MTKRLYKSESGELNLTDSDRFDVKVVPLDSGGVPMKFVAEGVAAGVALRDLRQARLFE